MSWATVPDAVADLARHQAGVLTRSQLLGCGVPSSVIGRLKQAWQPVAPGVYLAGNLFGPVPFESRVWAGVLIGGPDARAGGATAAVLHGLAEEDDFRPRGSEWPIPVEILTPRPPTPVEGFTFIRERSTTRLPWARQEPPRTCIEDTAFSDFGTLVEFDGLLGHIGDGTFRDMERDNAHAVLGWTTLRFGWYDLLGAPWKGRTAEPVSCGEVGAADPGRAQRVHPGQAGSSVMFSSS